MTADLFLLDIFCSDARQDVKCTVNTAFKEFKLVYSSLSAQIILQITKS